MSRHGGHESFDLVLQRAQDAERARLRWFRIRWVLRHAFTGAVALWVIVAVGPTVILRHDDAGSNRLLTLIAIPIVGWPLLVGFVGVSVLLVVVTSARLVAIARADDLAAFERRHLPSAP